MEQNVFAKQIMDIWIETCKNFGFIKNIDIVPILTSIIQDIIKAYNNDRYYHSVGHLYQCIVTADTIKNRFDYPYESIMALFFHDFVYDTHKEDIVNVTDSADECEKYLRILYKSSNLEPDIEVIERVKLYIYGTTHTSMPVSNDQALIMDIDLMMIAIMEPKWIEENIRKEYEWVDINIYRRARKNILINLYIKERIFYTHIDLVVSATAKQNFLSMIQINGVNVGVGGTFDLLHDGHKMLLDASFEIAGDSTDSRVMIGVTSDGIASKKVHMVQSFDERVKQIEDFIRDRGYKTKWSILPLIDHIGDMGTNPDYDILVASTETQKGADYVNEVRKENGLNQVILHIIDVLNDEEGDRISSTKLRSKMEG